MVYIVEIILHSASISHPLFVAKLSISLHQKYTQFRLCGRFVSGMEEGISIGRKNIMESVFLQSHMELEG